MRLSQIMGADYKPGLQFKIPFVDHVVKFDRRVLTRKFDGEQFLTSESQGLTVDYYIKWRISDAEHLLPGDQRRRRRPRRIAGRRQHPGRHQERRGRAHAARTSSISDRQQVTGEFMTDAEHASC